MHNGQLNIKKALLLALVLSMSTVGFVKIIESLSLVAQFLPFITVLLVVLGIVHFMIMFVHEILMIHKFIKTLISFKALKKPVIKKTKTIPFKMVKINIQFQQKNTQENLCVFRC